ncbi:MAG: hypothetical protein ACOCVF_02975 [bacterium]
MKHSIVSNCTKCHKEDSINTLSELYPSCEESNQEKIKVFKIEDYVPNSGPRYVTEDAFDLCKEDEIEIIENLEVGDSHEFECWGVERLEDINSYDEFKKYED